MKYLDKYIYLTSRLNKNSEDVEALRELIDLYEGVIDDHEVRDSIPLYVTDLGGDDVAKYLRKKSLESKDEFLKKEFEDLAIYILKNRSKP
jgi:DNA-binding ferritin-like protein (Dps family)